MPEYRPEGTAFGGFRKFPPMPAGMTDDQRIKLYRDRWKEIAKTEPWETLTRLDKIAVVKACTVRPVACGMCGKVPQTKIQLWNKSGEYRSKLSDWFYACRACGTRYMNRNKQGPGAASSQFKPGHIPHNKKVRKPEPEPAHIIEPKYSIESAHTKLGAACPVQEPSIREKHQRFGRFY